MKTQLSVNINVLKHEIYSLIDLSQIAINQSTIAYKKGDIDLAKKVIEDDKHINELRDKIRDYAIEILMLNSPVASDMRKVYSFLNISNELERIGDYCKDMCKQSKKLEEGAEIRHNEDIIRMAETCIAMLRKVKISIEERNSSLAYNVAAQDDNVDAFYKKLQESLIRKAYRDEITVEVLVDTLFISRALERIGDHITNICENIIYLIEGEIVETNR